MGYRVNQLQKIFGSKSINLTSAAQQLAAKKNKHILIAVGIALAFGIGFYIGHKIRKKNEHDKLKSDAGQLRK